MTVFAALAGALAHALARRSVRADHPRSRAPRGGGRRRRRRVRLRAARRRAGAGAAHAADAGRRCRRAVARRGPGTAAMVWLWALAAVLAWDPWARAHARLLAVVRRGRAAAVRAAPDGSAPRPPPTVAARALRAHVRAGAHAQWLVTVGTGAADAGAVPAGVAGLAARQRGGDSRGDVRRRAAGAGRASSLPVDALLAGGARGARAADAACWRRSRALPGAVVAAARAAGVGAAGGAGRASPGSRRRAASRDAALGAGLAAAAVRRHAAAARRRRRSG